MAEPAGQPVTELIREFGIADACRWIGNSPAVAAWHDDMSMDVDADFKRATSRRLDPSIAEKSQ